MAAVRERRTDAQKAEVAALIHRLYGISQCETWADFARLTGVHWASLSDWQLGKSVPDGWNLLRMIRAVLRVRHDVTLMHVVGDDPIAPPPPRHLDPDLRRAVNDLQDQVDDLRRRLDS